MYIDTHSHVYAEEFDNDRDDVIKRAIAAGVSHLILPDIDQYSRGKMLQIAATYPHHLFPTLGLHPTSINQEYKGELKLLEQELDKHNNILAIGECGLDFYWDKTYYKEQIAALEWQLHIARDMRLPVIIHSRESISEIFNILQRQPYNIRGIFHCFPGNEEDASRAIDLGFLLGIGGIITFKKSTMAEVVRQKGAKSIVLETDSPYLAPIPYRGKRNESCYIPLIANKIAEITGIDSKKIAEITTNNAMKLFNLSHE